MILELGGNAAAIVDGDQGGKLDYVGLRGRSARVRHILILSVGTKLYRRAADSGSRKACTTRCARN
ncbi:MAG: Delta-1-pyrroline-5-carboxylate dehydrogenase (EC [uncultured Paraburkholderia sp.]|nr:MAG: Delta-1-pyrroline-5-carboxylate dehydrogenase (EC [uncultured Paraburkholderia sp.]CAH2932466.1 MAG: Delta-1-pyrroline-5-carboxylate dehydrogenase (EC [uncultured Paraburkholderia sp.]